MVGRRKVARDVPAIGADALSQDVSDDELLRRHVAGDAEAFGTLFARHKDRLWAVALRTVCDPEDAADALQEAMISAFRRAADFRGDSAVTTWLHRIVVNAAVDRLRRRSTRSVSWSGDPDALEALAMQGSQDGTSLTGSPTAGATGQPASSANAADAIDTRLDVDAALRMLPRAAAQRPGARRHDGLPGRRRGRNPRGVGRHREEPVRSGPRPIAALSFAFAQ